MSRDEGHLLDMLVRARRAISYTTGIDEQSFLSDSLVQDAVIRRLQVIGDAAGRVTEDFKERHPSIDWYEIRGMRNRLVHEYGEVDLREVWRACTRDCPTLVAHLEQLLPRDGTPLAD